MSATVTCAPTDSLKSGLVRRLVPLQGGLLAVFALIIVTSLWFTGFILHQRDEDRVIHVLQDALTRDASGHLALRPTRYLDDLREDNPNLWFQIRDGGGQTLTEGIVPPQFAGLGPALDGIGQAKLGFDQGHSKYKGKDSHFSARLKRVNTAAGEVQIIATSDVTLSDLTSWLQLALAFLALTLPGLVLMTLATKVATPMVVRRALAGLADAAQRAREIDIDKRGTRLPVTAIPGEVTPLVDAVNDALGRLDEGYERHKRFLTDAAHELRTPIAILTTSLESLPDEGTDKTQLLQDAARLANLMEQLLDLQRLDQRIARLSTVDLVAICARVTADLAPMAIAAGYDISLLPETDRIEAWGDESSLERAVVNLVQNAIQHGGRRGIIVVAVHWPAIIEVIDQGPGIPPSQREQVFEAFHRVRPLDRGAGLGLNLVREIVRLHQGEVEIGEGPGGGTRVRVTLAPIAVPYLAAG
ncbi:HAMP domain-containing sensor histidine kinase [Bradyrhizobium prioriisuperbiae]|uniref:sensor histidine kinase n=1 Tax=Bradyrhizobium prioriisuperbiae TaxID=2854389 RepID=UPI0028E9532D|nr:HAMP domain-containing sensor histidine kinase [Bradyrhizobium prioritasuperba]